MCYIIMSAVTRFLYLKNVVCFWRYVQRCWWHMEPHYSHQTLELNMIEPVGGSVLFDGLVKLGKEVHSLGIVSGK